MPCVSQKASWIGDSSPGLGLRPSIVLMPERSACGAKIRQERTASPSSSTVQAPQTPCSQPACAPFRPSASRRQSSSVVRSSTSSAYVTLLTLSSMRMGLLPPRMTARMGNRASRELVGGAAAVFGRSMQIGQRLKIGERLAQRRTDHLLIDRRALELLLGGRESHWEIGRGAYADGDALAFSIGPKLDLRRCRDESEVAAPCVHFVEADADLAQPHRKANAGETGSGGQGRRPPSD